MIVTGSHGVAATGAPAQPAVEVLERLAWLDLCDAQEHYARGVDADASFYIRVGVSMEYRRFLLLRLTHPRLTIPAPPLIDGYWRLHAADQAKFAADCAMLVAGTGVSPDALHPPPQPSQHPPDQQIRQLYEAMFPCGHADLWGWAAPQTGPRNSAPDLGSVHIRVPSALDESTRAALREEAAERRVSVAKSIQSQSPSFERGSMGCGFSRYSYAHAGPALHTAQWDGSLARLIGAQTGAIVAPAGAYYLYYRSGDSLPFHTDPYGEELVLLTLLSGPVEPLHCHLHLADTPLEEIQTLAQAAGGLPEGGTPFEISAVPFLFSGHRIPHHRRPQHRHDEAIVSVQFFGSLLQS